MKLTVLGGSGARPTAEQACSGYVVEHDGFRLLIDPGYASFPKLQAWLAPEDVDAVYVSHGHPDHCADLNPLLRARALADEVATPLPVYAPGGALGTVLALDRPGMLDEAYRLHQVVPGRRFAIGPYTVDTRLLPHWLPNLGVRLTAGQTVLTYTGDTGPAPGVIDLARDSDLLIAEATYVDRVPGHSVGYLSSARDAAVQASAAGVGHLMLTHLWPGTDAAAARDVARESYPSRVSVAAGGLTVDL